MKFAQNNHPTCLFSPTLIFLINDESTLTNFEKFHPPSNKNPPSTFIEVLDFSILHVYSNLHVLLRWYISEEIMFTFQFLNDKIDNYGVFFDINAWNFSTKVLYMSKKHKFHPPQNNNFSTLHVYSNLYV